MQRPLTALSLLSGGLDSIIAAKMMQEQGINVICLYFSSPFWSNEAKESFFTQTLAKENNLDIHIIPVDDDYLDLIRKPAFGWGSAMNPCVDCKVYMLRKAKALMAEYSASFLVTGEVLGQRPMSQKSNTLNYIEKNAEVRGILVRPLSAKLLPSTEPELKGWLDRNKMADINGRGRKRQFELAAKYGIKGYSPPAGGCILTDNSYALKIKDLLDHQEKISINDVDLLKYGRHFRYQGSKIIVGRHENDNDKMQNLMGADDYAIEALNCSSPLTLLQGKKSSTAVEYACRLTADYSNAKENEVEVMVYNDGFKEMRKVTKLAKNEAREYNVSLQKFKKPCKSIGIIKH